MDLLTPPPARIDYEILTLACIVADNSCFDDVMAYGVTSEWFTDPFRKDVFQAIRNVHQKGVDIDELALTDELAGWDQYERVGTHQRLCTEITNHAETSVQLPIHLENIREAFELRNFWNLSLKINDLSKDKEGLEKIPAAITACMDHADPETEHDINTVCHEYIDNLRERNENRVKFEGLATGIHPLDRILGGLRDGSFNVIAARPSCGKTTMGNQIGLNVAFMDQVVRFHSMEMPVDQLTERSLINLSEVNPKQAGDGLLTEEHFERLHRARIKFKERMFRINDVAKVNTSRVASKLRKDIHRNPGKKILTIIDYLTLMRPMDKMLPREQQVASIARELKETALEHGMPIIGLAQLNRNADETKEPNLSDLRESGAIEQDADSVIMLWRHPEEGKLNVKVAKNRHGPRGKFVLNYPHHLHQIW